MFDLLLRKCMANFDPGCSVAYDEATLGYSGRTVLLVRTNLKKVPSGVQAWCMCDSETAYVWWLEFCKDSLAHKADEPGLSKTHAALYRVPQTICVWKLAHHLPGQPLHISKDGEAAARREVPRCGNIENQQRYA